MLGLVLVGAIALAWPWLSEDVPRAIAAELALVQALLAEWLRQLTDWLRSLVDWLHSLADWLRSLAARLPRFN